MVVLSLPSVPLVRINLNQLSHPARHVQQVNAIHQYFGILEICIHSCCVLKIYPFLFPVPGFYCLEGSSFPTPCPAGTLGHIAGLQSLLDCSLCPPGFYCNSSALTTPSGPCSAGQCLWLFILLLFLVRARFHKLLSDPFSQRSLLFIWSHRT